MSHRVAFRFECSERGGETGLQSGRYEGSLVSRKCELLQIPSNERFINFSSKKGAPSSTGIPQTKKMYLHIGELRIFEPGSPANRRTRCVPVRQKESG